MVNKMKIGRKGALVGITILFCTLIFGAAGVLAKKPVRTELTFEYEWTGGTDPAKKEWTTDKGVLHTLQTPHYGKVTVGDIEGEVYYCGNLILDLNTLSGKGGGIFEFTGKYNGEAAGFKGKLIFEIEDRVLTGTLNCPGSGAFEGILLKGTVNTILWETLTNYATLVLWT